jgi:hypothetical protein
MAFAASLLEEELPRQSYHKKHQRSSLETVEYLQQETSPLFLAHAEYILLVIGVTPPIQRH